MERKRSFRKTFSSRLSRTALASAFRRPGCSSSDEVILPRQEHPAGQDLAREHALLLLLVLLRLRLEIEDARRAARGLRTNSRKSSFYAGRGHSNGVRTLRSRVDDARSITTTTTERTTRTRTRTVSHPQDSPVFRDRGVRFRTVMRLQFVARSGPENYRRYITRARSKVRGPSLSLSLSLSLSSLSSRRICVFRETRSMPSIVYDFSLSHAPPENAAVNLFLFRAK